MKQLLSSLTVCLLLICVVNRVSATCGIFTVPIGDERWTWDLRALTQPSGSEWTLVDIYNQQYWWNFCKVVSEGGSTCQNAGVCQVSAQSRSYSCGQAYTMISAPLQVSKWIDGRAVGPLNGVSVRLTGGSAYSTGVNRATDIHVICDLTSPTKALNVLETPGVGYNIYMSSPAACPSKYGTGVVATDSALNVMWRMQFNGTAPQWDLMASNLKSPGAVAMDTASNQVYWVPSAASPAPVVFTAPFNNITWDTIQTIDGSRWPSASTTAGVAAADGNVVVQYSSDRMAALVGSSIYTVQDQRFILRGECVVKDDKAFFIHVQNSNDLDGYPYVWLRTSPATNPLWSPAILMRQMALKSDVLVVMSSYNVLYWSKIDKPGTPFRQFSLANVTSAKVLDIAIDSLGVTYVLDDTPSITVLPVDGKVFNVPIPPHMKIQSLSGI